ncbi:hypothetical protein FRB99_008967, partial [Tulasnella sp. 403]
RIVIHRYSSILSAYGLALADRAIELQEPSSHIYTPSSLPHLLSRLQHLSQNSQSTLQRQGFKPSHIIIERYLNMRWEGTDTAIMVLGSTTHCGEEGEKDKEEEDFEVAFKNAYKKEFGFLLEDKRIVVDDIKVGAIFHLMTLPSVHSLARSLSLKVRGIGKTYTHLPPSPAFQLSSFPTSTKPLAPSSSTPTTSVYFANLGRVPDTPIYQLGELNEGDVVKGPAVILDDTQTIVVIPEATVRVLKTCLYVTLDEGEREE